LAIQLIIKDLANAVKFPDVLEYRVNMAKGSLYAGIAFSQTKTTACHAISYPLTAHFRIPHGLACAMTLPSMFEFNAPVIGKKAQKLTEWFGADSIQATPQKIRDIMKPLNVQTRLNKGNIDIDSVFNVDSLTDRIMNNPKEIKKEHITQIIENIL
jgi:alcohol dehydrogenase class IV